MPRKTSASVPIRAMMPVCFNEAAARCRGKLRSGKVVAHVHRSLQ